MASYYISDYNEHQILITNLVQDWLVPKFRILMSVTEPYLYLYWNDRERGTGGDERLLILNYLDVVDGYGGYVDNPQSAQELADTIDTMIVSGFGGGGGDILTAKADLLSHDGVSDTILAGGTNEYFLQRDNTETTGLKWSSALTVIAAGLPGYSASPGNYKNYGTSSVGAFGYYYNSFIIGGASAVNSTNTTSEELLMNILIPGGTLASGDMVEFSTYSRKSSGVGSTTVKWYLNSSSGVGGGGATQYGQLITTSANNQTFAPRVKITGASSQLGYPATAGVLWGNIGGTYSAGTLNTSSDMYAQFTSTKAVGTDGYILEAGVVIIHKKRT